MRLAEPADCPNHFRMTRDPLLLIDAIASAPDDATRSRLLSDGARDLLADPAAIPDIGAAAIGSADDPAARAAGSLLSMALTEARMARENDAPEGAALIDTLDEALAALDAARPFAPTMRLRLAQFYARAGLAPPPFATLSDEGMAEGMAGSGEMPDLGALIDPILQEIGDAPLQVHGALSELLAGLPGELAAMLVSMTIARPGAIEARLGLYWLLDPKPEFQLAAATALLSRAEAGTLAPDIGALLPTLRKWLPDNAARAALDAAIRRQMQSGATRTAAPAPAIHRAVASLPDGVGAQSLIAAVQIGSRRALAMGMLKQGHGVKDAFVIPCASAGEQKRMLASILDEMESFDVSPETLAAMLAHGLGEGLALGLVPAPGMVDLAEIFGADALLPRAGGTEAILDEIGAAEALAGLPAARRRALIDASADWAEHFDQGESWFEDTGSLRAAIARARTDKGRETAVWKQLSSRRDWWARLFALAAAVLKPGAEADPAVWLSFAAVAQALAEGRPMKRIPVMADIMAMTLDAALARSGGASGVSGAGAQAGIGPLLDQAGLGAAYLQGYLTALAIAPLQPTAQDWLGALLGRIEIPGMDEIGVLLEFLMIEANQADDAAADAKAVARSLAPLAAHDLRDWAAGFDALVTATRPSWPARLLGAEDKRVLREIKRIASGSEGDALRGELPSWVARRHESRR